MSNEFNPDWDAMDVMVSEQQRMAKVVSTAPKRIWLDLGFDPGVEQEVSFHDLFDVTWSHDNATGNGIEYVRADIAPPQREFVGLTDEERYACTQSPFTAKNYRAIEAKLKEKNT